MNVKQKLTKIVIDGISYQVTRNTTRNKKSCMLCEITSFCLKNGLSSFCVHLGEHRYFKKAEQQ